MPAHTSKTITGFKTEKSPANIFEPAVIAQAYTNHLTRTDMHEQTPYR